MDGVEGGERRGTPASGEEDKLEMGTRAAESQNPRFAGQCGSTADRHARRQRSQDETGEESGTGSRRSESRIRKSGVHRHGCQGETGEGKGL